MLVTLAGISITDIEVPENALSPKVVTPYGIVILNKLPQSSKALSPISITLSGITYSVSDLPIGKRMIVSLFLLNKIPSTDV